ncbi:MAG: hypothetical protein AAGK97_14265 [Bacteroidota bacterium]
MTRQFKIVMLWSLIILGAVACSKDSTELSAEIEAIEARGGNNNGNNGPNNQNDRPSRNNDNNRNDVVSSLSNEITKEWMDLFLEIDRYAYGMRPNSTARSLAYISLGAYETAIPGMADYESSQRFLSRLEIDDLRDPNDVDFEVALNTSYSKLFQHFVINLPANESQKILALEETNANDFSQTLSSEVMENSVAWGTLVAEAIIEYALTDTEAEAQIHDPQPTSYVPPTGEGYWTFSAEPERALFPYWSEVRTFVIDPERTRSIEPIAYSENPNSEYYQQMQEVYDANNEAKTSNEEALWIAEFWSDDVEGLMFSPPTRQYSISNQLLES